MRNRVVLGLIALLVAAGSSGAVSAGPADDFAAAYEAADTASKLSLALKAQWTTTLAELKAAQDAARAGKYDAAIAHARKAEALAKASIAQAKDQETAWKDGVIR